jgi:hypothetical protein
LRANSPHGAYYLAGYAVECALKACIARKTERHDFPSRQAVNESYSHDVSKLLKASGLQPTFDADARLDRQLEINWGIVKDWTEESRYDSSIPMATARELYSAITARTHGVMRWVRRHW